MPTSETLDEWLRLRSEANRLNLESVSLRHQGDLSNAIATVNRMIAVRERLLELALESDDAEDARSTTQWIVMALFSGSDILHSLGREDEANAFRERAASLTDENLDEAEHLHAERMSAAAHLSEGRFNEALVAFATERDIAERQGDLVERVQSSLNLVGVLVWMGDFERAREELDNASTLLQPLIEGGAPTRENLLSDLLFLSLSGLVADTTLGDPATTMALHFAAMDIDYHRGKIACHFGEHDDARRLLEKVLPKYRSHGMEGPVRNIEYWLAVVQVNRGAFADALATIERLEPAFRMPGMLRCKLAAVLRVKAEALIGLCRAAEAVSILNEALADSRNFRDPNIEWRVAWQLGAAHAACGHESDALVAYLQAVDTVDRMRTGSLGYRLDSTFLADKLPLFNEVIEFAAREGEADIVAHVVERIKARGLALALRAPESSEDADYADQELELAALSRQLDALEYAAYRDGWTEERSADFERLRDERAKLVERLRFSDPRWRRLSEPPNLDLYELAETLAERNQAVLDLYLSGDTVTCVLLTGGEHEVASIALSEDAQRGLAELVRFLEQADDDGVADSVDLSRSFGIDASAFIPEELLDRALERDSVIFVPHGVLHLVSWAGLTRASKRLFECVAVGVVPNLACLLALGGEMAAAPRVSLIGNPDYAAYPGLPDLKGAAEELEQIAALCADGDRLVVEPVVREQADEAAFWRLAAHDRSEGAILHAACHGTLEVDDPLASGLLFTRGKVDAAEIARGRLRYDEAVLSACSTGWRPQAVGKVALHGDDILGIPGALLEAGLRTVIVSIPPADDLAASDLTVHYHRERMEHPPLIAFRNAQRSMLEQGEHPPFTWIGFTLYGCA